MRSLLFGTGYEARKLTTLRTLDNVNIYNSYVNLEKKMNTTFSYMSIFKPLQESKVYILTLPMEERLGNKSSRLFDHAYIHTFIK